MSTEITIIVNKPKAMRLVTIARSVSILGQVSSWRLFEFMLKERFRNALWLRRCRQRPSPGLKRGRGLPLPPV
jgi:hypothetical protein